MILHGDCMERMKEFPDNYFDAIVTDPPYGWGFMGKAWDKPAIEKRRQEESSRPPRKDGKSRGQGDPALCAGLYNQTLSGNHKFQDWTREWAKEAFRVLKPGGHALIFCGPRTYHRMASGVEDAGFEIRDQLQWIFGSGFPKSHNVGGGRGTALKPANEPIVLARKPLSEKTVAANVLRWGTGALNVDASRIGSETRVNAPASSLGNARTMDGGAAASDRAPTTAVGRWPANVLFDEEAAAMLDEQSGVLKRGGDPTNSGYQDKMVGGKVRTVVPTTKPNDTGGASRFFYVAKTSKRERNTGLEDLPAKESGVKNDSGRGFSESDPYRKIMNQNNHPTVKPIKLMEYLITMITPPEGIVLDPFAGSGSTGVAAKRLGYGFVGIEREQDYVEIATRRIDAW